jgi:hypothetical protein
VSDTLQQTSQVKKYLKALNKKPKERLFNNMRKKNDLDLTLAKSACKRLTDLAVLILSILT